MAQKIPTMIPPLPDELFISYLARLSDTNEFLSLSQFCNAYLWVNTSSSQRNRTIISYDANKEFAAFAASSSVTDDPVRFYLDHSVYGACAPFYTKRMQTKIVCNAFRPTGQVPGINVTVNSMIPTLRYCPECEKEDRKRYGTRVFYRRHNLPGVTVCKKHNIPLLEVEDTQTNFRKENAKTIECDVKNLAVSAAFAEYSERFLKAEPDLDAGIFSKAVFSKLREMGLYENGYGKLSALISEKGLDTYFENGVEYFMKVPFISRQYLSRISCMALSMLLFPNPESDFKKYRNTQHILRFVDVCKDGYDVFEPFRENILEMERKDTGERFVTTTDGFLISWREYSADYGKTDQEKFDEIFASVQDGSYMCLEPFSGMSTPIRMIHKKCGSELEISPRDFLETGRRCLCESRITRDQAEQILEDKTSGAFSLVDYNGTDQISVFLHKSCGHTFPHVFRTFLDHPFCPACRTVIRTNDSFQKEIHDLTGDDYTLAGEYTDKNTKVAIRHEKCGKISEYLPRHFLDGQRCPYCTREISDTVFSKMVQDISVGVYRVAGKETRNLYTIENTSTGEEIQLTKQKALQELRRPTPSEILPLDKKGQTQEVKNVSDRIFDFIKARYSDESLIFLEDISIPGVPYSQIKGRVTDLVKHGKLVRIGLGVLAFHPMEVSDERMIKERYLVRNGHREGIFFGPSLAYELDVIDEKPATIQVLTNRESSGTGGRTKHLGSITMRLRGSEYLITDRNYKIIEAIELASGQFHYGWDWERLKKAFSRLGVTENDCALYISDMNERDRKALEILLGESN